MMNKYALGRARGLFMAAAAAGLLVPTADGHALRPAPGSTTRLSDVIYGPLFIPTVTQKIQQLSALRTSGIAVDDPLITQFAQAAGDQLTMPFFTDISGDSNVSSDDPAQSATPNKLVMAQDSARKIRRNNGWQSANLVASLLKADPLDVVASLIANYWIREEEKILVQVLNGIFASASMSGLVLDVSQSTIDGTHPAVNYDAVVDTNAKALLGEYGVEFTAVMMHSRVYFNLEAQGAIVYGKDPVSGLAFRSYNGKRVILSDACQRVAVTGGYKYASYLFGQGGVAYAECTGAAGPKKPVEIESNASAGNGEGVETVWYRRHFIMHPRGVAFTGTLAGESPTNAELATGSKWTRVYDPKVLRFVQVWTNG